MKISSLMITTVVAAFLLTSCASYTGHPSATQLAGNVLHREAVIATSKEKYPPKNPQHIAFYSQEQKPSRPYRIIGIATVSKTNFIGITRREDAIDTIMQKLAASIGGDAVIDMRIDDHNVQANIIAFEKILV